MMPSIHVHGATHPGLVHLKNEDSHAIVHLPGGGLLLVVCDGMGGMGRGDQASALAVQAIRTSFTESAGTPRERLRLAIRAADDGVREALCVGGNGWAGSTAVLVHIEGATAHVAWVGDSRVYLLRGGKLVERTRDHKLVQELVDSGQLTPEEARRSTLGSVITRALGGKPPGVSPVEPADLDHPWELVPGDRVLLCSDGLCDLVPDAEMPKLVGSDAAGDAADRLIQTAVARGGHDNITVVMVGVGDVAPAAPHAERGTLELPVALIVAGILAAGGAAWGLVQACRSLTPG